MVTHRRPIAQTINTIIDSHDEIKIKKTLDELNVEKYELTKTSKIPSATPKEPTTTVAGRWPLSPAT